MSHGMPESGLERFPAQQRDYDGSSEWHDCGYWYTAEEVAIVNFHYGWEKCRLVPEKFRPASTD